jgi:hypothetical protein
MTRKYCNAAEPRASIAVAGAAVAFETKFPSEDEEGRSCLASANTNIEEVLVSDSSDSSLASFRDSDMVCRATLLHSSSLSCAFWRKGGLKRLAASSTRLAATAALDCRLRNSGQTAIKINSNMNKTSTDLWTSARTGARMRGQRRAKNKKSTMKIP